MFAIRLLTALSLAATCAAQGLDVRLHQYDWPLNDGSIVEYSRAGAFELLFDDRDVQLLAANGGGFVNIVLLDNHTGEINWLVRNLPLSFQSTAEMYEMPYIVPFGMGEKNGIPWGLSVLSTSVSAKPAQSMPIDYIQVMNAEPSLYPFMIGGWIDDGAGLTASSGDPNQVSLDAQCGLQGPGGDEPTIVCTGAIIDIPGGVPAPKATGNNCGPASVAGSIAYMAALNGRPMPPVQQVYEGLRDCMGTDANGTTTSNLLSGKNAYTCQNELPICSEILQGPDWVCTVASILQMGGDVELMFRRGDCSQPGAEGHIAMIHGIARYSDGTIMVETMEPTIEPDGTTSWAKVPIFFDQGGGLLLDPSTGANKGCLWGFFAEIWQSSCFCAH
ncbi:MAG: hypothetical protein L6Q99_18665 [Planctomycetes bacterium]|nr:hypothetical protein [Planctomycetota bacterium]